jgi:hypothetical protein
MIAEQTSIMRLLLYLKRDSDYFPKNHCKHIIGEEVTPEAASEGNYTI